MKLLVVDGNSIVNRAFYGIKALTTKNGEFTNGIYGFLMILRRMLDEVQPTNVAIAFDLRQPTFRHLLYDGYKANRKGMPKELASQLEPLKAILRALGYRIVTCAGYEADDILGTLASVCKNNGAECVIATGDRDSLQLVDTTVTVRLASTKMGQPVTTLFDVRTVQDKYGVMPEQLIDVKAFMGDSSDNIPGVPGIGEKSALSLISKYGSFEKVYQHLDDLTPSVRNKLEQGREKADMSLVLARIDCNAPINTDLNHYAIRPVNQLEAARLFSRLEMYKMQKKWGIDPAALSIEMSGEEQPDDECPLIVQKENLGAFLEQGCCALFHFREDQTLAAALIRKGEIYFTDDVQEIHEILIHGDKLQVWSSKPLYKYGMDQGLEMPLVAFDGELAAYLLNPANTKYQMTDLANQYAVRAQEISGGIPTSFMVLVETAQIAGNLFRRLENEIREKDQEKLLQEIEIPLAQVLASMELEGFALDSAALKEYGAALDTRLEELQKSIYEAAGTSFNLNSPKQMGAILFEQLKLPPKKKTKTGYSTNADVLEELRGSHPIIELILEHRQLIKLKSTYVEGLLKVIGRDGRVRTTFQQTETRTGRISSTEPNLQNIPVRTEEGSKLRAFFQARPGWKLLDADYSQIELRVLAHISKDKAMQKAFQEGADIHTTTAAQVFKLPEEMITPAMRFRAKAVNFGIVYGISAFSLSQDTEVSVQEADQYIKGYLETYSGVRQYMEDTVAFAKENGYVKTMFGRRRNLPELASAKKTMRSFGERVAMNTPIQGTAADIIKIAMIRVYRRLRQEGLMARLILQVHDELLVEAPVMEAEQAARILQEEMEHAISLDVPLVAETHQGNTWLDAK
ncbi:DNA polymerase I [bacterium 1XD42-1]|nr:DNA polymerase I [bacterium 1XD42-8]RKJ67208.1 DNA polymerase I [bacterium 1XD42-1]